MGIDETGVDELLALMGERGISNDDAYEIIRAPFELRFYPRQGQTRFSDGSIRVFYSALEQSTAEAEVYYWYVKPLLEGGAKRTVYLRCATCVFDGLVKDLRPKLSEWPFLIDDAGYPECNRIGAEASQTVAGLLTWSARKHDGTNLPTFTQVALSNPVLKEFRVFYFDPESGLRTITA